MDSSDSESLNGNNEKKSEESTDEPRVKRAKFSLTTRDVMRWCQENGHTPQNANSKCIISFSFSFFFILFLFFHFHL